MSRWIDLDELNEKLDIFIEIGNVMACTTNKEDLDSAFGIDLTPDKCRAVGNIFRTMVRDVVKTCKITEFDIKM